MRHGGLQCGSRVSRKNRSSPSCKSWRPARSPLELTRRHGISRETLRNWQRKYGGLKSSDAKRLKALEDENRRLKRMVADQALNIQALKDVLGKTW